MSEVTTSTETNIKSRAAKPPAASTTTFRIPPFDVPRMEMPEALHDAALGWINQGKETFERAVKATEEMNDALEGAYSTASRRTLDYSAKVTEAVHANAIAAFDFVHDVLAAESLPEMMQISSTHARKQIEDFAAQSQALWALTQQLATDTAKPVTGGLSKVLGAASST